VLCLHLDLSNTHSVKNSMCYPQIRPVRLRLPSGASSEESLVSLFRAGFRAASGTARAQSATILLRCNRSATEPE